MTDLRYRAFVSYSHASDAQLAASLQSSLSRFAKPWYRLRTMRVFLDKTSLSANPALWPTIEQALGQSEYFLLLASPTSANSVWVQQEVRWWLQNKTAEKLVVCLTDGVILWDNKTGDFDWDKTNAVPAILKGAFPSEPLYADFRAAKTANKYAKSDPAFRDALLDLAAPLLGRPKDDLDGEDIRLHRKTERIAWAAAFFIVVFALAAGLGVTMAHQRQKIAASRALASEAASHGEDRSLAMLLSIESRKIADTVESRRSLLTTLQRLPNTEAFLWGHTDAVTKAVLSPDGQTVLSAGWDNRVVLWNAATYQPIGPPIPAPKGLVGAAFSPNGSQFVTASSGSIVLWDTKSRQRLGDALRASEEFEHVGFSSKGDLIAASTAAFGGHPSVVLVWSLANHQLIGDPIPGSNFAFSPDDSVLAVAQYGDLVLYDIHKHRVLRKPLTGHDKNISTIAFSADGSTVAAGVEDQTIIVWDVQSGQLLGTLAGNTETVSSLLFENDGETLLSGSLDGTIIRWNLEEMKPLATLIKGFDASISSIFSTPDHHVKALALDKERVILLNVNDDPPLGRRINATDSNSSNVAFSPDGRLLASAGEFGSVVLWDVETGQVSGDSLSGHEHQVSSIAFSPNGKILVSGSMDGSIIFWDLSSRTALGPPVMLRSSIWSLACSPDGKTVVAGEDAELVFFDLATRKQLGPPVTSQKDRIWTLAFSPNGDLLASAGNSLVVMIWKNGQQGQLLKALGTPLLPGEDFEVMPTGVSFNADGTMLATSTQGHSVTLWDVKGWRPIAPVLYGHTQAVSGVAFSADGKVLASGSADGNIRIWDVQTHELIGSLGVPPEGVNSIALDRRKGILASVGEKDSIVLWNLNFNDWVSQACRIANRNLTTKEWGTFFGTKSYQKTCPGL
ncbi:MAG TPA: TIR domain-containing protein [Terracidiphilus sp.]